MAPAEKKVSSEVWVLFYIQYTPQNNNIHSVISSSTECTGLSPKEWNADDPSFYIIY